MLPTCLEFIGGLGFYGFVELKTLLTLQTLQPYQLTTLGTQLAGPFTACARTEFTPIIGSLNVALATTLPGHSFYY